MHSGLFSDTTSYRKYSQGKQKILQLQRDWMEINGLQEQDIFIIRLSGRMDTATVQKFTDFIQENETRDSDKIILDMGKLEYVSSAGLRGLLTYAKKIEAKKGSLLLCSLEGLVKEVFELSGFNKIFTITADIDEARSRLH